MKSQIWTKSKKSSQEKKYFRQKVLELEQQEKGSLSSLE